MSTSSCPQPPHESLAGSQELTAAPRWASKRNSAFRSARRFVSDNAGLFLVLVSQAFFSMMNAAVKRLSMIDPPVSTLQVIFVRMAITYVCGLVYMYGTGVENPILGPKGVRLLLVSRGIAGFVGLFGPYYSLQYLSLSEVTVLTFLAPLCTTVASALFLKETFRISQALAGVVSLIGVILIAHPPFLFEGGPGVPVDVPNSFLLSEFMVKVTGEVTPAERMIAVGVLLLSVLGTTGAYTLVHGIGNRAHAMHIMNYFAILCIFITTIGMSVNRTPFIIPPRLEWFALLLLVGTFGFVAQILLTMGLQQEAAGRASMAIYTQIVYATIFQFLFFHTSPTWLSALGTCLILSSAIYVAMTKPEKTSKPSTQGPVSLGDDDYDHLEAALYAPPETDDTTR